MTLFRSARRGSRIANVGHLTVRVYPEPVGTSRAESPIRLESGGRVRLCLTTEESAYLREVLRRAEKEVA